MMRCNILYPVKAFIVKISLGIIIIDIRLAKLINFV